MGVPRTNRIMIIVLMAVAAAAFTAGTTRAGVPPMIQYQGRLTDDAGNPLDTVVDMTFAIYNDSLGSLKYWEEIHSGVVVSEGLFEVMLGETEAFPKQIYSGNRHWLGISISGGAVMQPLTPMVSSLYAFRSQRSDTASYATLVDTAQYAINARHADTAEVALNAGANGWIDAGNEVYLSTITDSVGIGVTNPSAPLDVEGPGHAIIGTSLGSGTAAGVLGMNDNTAYGVWGVSTSGRGVFGWSLNGWGGFFYGPKHYFSSNLGIGTETPEEMLHVYKNNSGADAFLKIQSAHATNWGVAGVKFQTPQNTWHLFMDDDENYDCPEGGLGLYNTYLGQMCMTWARNGHVGIPTYSAGNRFSVYAADNAILGSSTSGIGVYGYSQSGYGGYFTAPKHYFSGKTGFATMDPTHQITVNGAVGIQKSGVTKYHLLYYNAGFSISETSVADYRIYVKDGGNVGIGTSNPTAKLHVAGTLHADAFEQDAINKNNILDDVGIASVAGDVISQDVTSSWAPYLTCEITVPAGGYVLAIGSALFVLDHGVSGNTEAMLACSDMSNSLNGSYYQMFGLFSDVGAGTYFASVTAQRLFTVPSQGTYTYYLIAERDPDNPVTIRYKQMRLLYIASSYASKNGEMIACPAGEVPDNHEISINTAGQRSAKMPGDSDVRLQSDAVNAAISRQFEDLTAEIESLKRRLQAVENR